MIASRSHLVALELNSCFSIGVRPGAILAQKFSKWVASWEYNLRKPASEKARRNQPGFKGTGSTNLIESNCCHPASRQRLLNRAIPRAFRHWRSADIPPAKMRRQTASRGEWFCRNSKHIRAGTHS